MERRTPLHVFPPPTLFLGIALHLPSPFFKQITRVNWSLLIFLVWNHVSGIMGFPPFEFFGGAVCWEMRKKGNEHIANPVPIFTSQQIFPENSQKTFATPIFN